MHRKKKITFFLLVFFMFFVFAPVNYAAATTETAINDIAEEIEDLYSYADADFNIPAIEAAQAKLEELTPEQLEEIAGSLVTSQVTAKYEAYSAETGIDLYNKAEWERLMTELMAFTYLSDTDPVQLRTDIDNFREKFSPHFKVLFGEDITMDDLARLLQNTRDQIRPVIGLAGAGILANDDNPVMIEKMTGYLYDALDIAVSQPGNEMFQNKFAELGWNKELLVQQSEILAGYIDNDTQDAQRSLALIAIRSETTPIADAVLSVGDQPTYSVTIMGKDASSLVGWYSLALGIVQVTETNQGFDIEAVGPGTTELLAYRYYPTDGSGSEPLKDWLVRFNVTVRGDETVIGYATWYKIDDNAGITVTAKQDDTIIATTATDVDGLFKLTLEDGTYNLELTVPGYLKTIIQNVTVVNGILVEVSTLAVPIKMSAGDIYFDEQLTENEQLVDLSDLSELASVYGLTNSDSNYLQSADFDRDGFIDLSDLTYFANHYGEKVRIIEF